MKNSKIRNVIQLLFCPLFVVSCSDWTETESLNIQNPSLEDVNPELYESYIESLKEYKASEHKIVIAKFDNKETNPVGQGEHISALPDSVDYVILNNPINLNHTVKDDILEIREKGTRTLYTIDYSLIEKEFNASIENVAPKENSESIEGEGNEEPEEDPFIEFCSQKMDFYLNLFKEYNCDGINVVYNGIDPLSLNETDRLKLEMRNQVFFGKVKEWKDNNKEAIFFFEGKPQNILFDKSLLQKTTFIVVPNESATNAQEMLFETKMALVQGVPTDRTIFGVTIPSLTDSKDKTGYFDALENGKQMYATKGAAFLVISANDDFVQAGLCISRSQNDYYDANNNYKNIREAISIMNPSPLN